MNAAGMPADGPLAMNESELRRMFGYSESHYAFDTCQFSDYSKYAANLFPRAMSQAAVLARTVDECREA